MGSQTVTLYMAVCDSCGLTYDEIDEEHPYGAEPGQAEEIAVDGGWHRGDDDKVYCEDCPGVSMGSDIDEDLPGTEPVEVILSLGRKGVLVPDPAMDAWLAAHHA